MWTIVYTAQAQKDAEKIKRSPYLGKVKQLLATLARDPFELPFERLVGNLSGACSRRINAQHRLVYQVLENERVVKVLRMWTHYGE